MSIPRASRGVPGELHARRAPLDRSGRLDTPGCPGNRYEPYLYWPDGVGRSNLAADLGWLKGDRGTMRNWGTLTKLLELTDEAGAVSSWGPLSSSGWATSEGVGVEHQTPESDPSRAVVRRGRC